MKELYDLLTYPLSVVDDPVLDFMLISILGSIAFVIAWNIVGDTGIRGKAGSILHWTIRFIVMFILCTLTTFMIKIIIFIKSIPATTWFTVLLCLLILSLLVFLIYLTIFNKKEITKRKANKSKNEYLLICKKIINNYYYESKITFKKNEILDGYENDFIFNEIIELLKTEKLILMEGDEHIISLKTILFLEEIINKNMAYIVTALAFETALIALFISYFGDVDSPITNFICIVLLIFLVGSIINSFPKDFKITKR